MKQSVSNKRWKITLAEIMAVRDVKLMKLVPAKKLDCEFCNDLKNEEFMSSWDNFQIYAGLENKWIKKSGLLKCKKSDATSHLFVGEKNENGYFINNQYKHYWLKSVQ